MSLDSFKTVVGTAVHKLLASHQFRKKSQVFSRAMTDAIQYIALQSSDASSNSVGLKITVNLGILIPSLCDQWQSRDIWSCHWRQRLGYVLPEPSDRWWRIRSDLEAAVAAAEIIVALQDYGLPKLDEFGSKSALAELWRSGQAPGLTEDQRVRYLNSISSERSA